MPYGVQYTVTFKLTMISDTNQPNLVQVDAVNFILCAAVRLLISVLLRVTSLLCVGDTRMGCGANAAASRAYSVL